MAGVRPVRLRCEHLESPLAVHKAQPRLSWALEPADPAARGMRQTAWQIIVRSAGEVLWDSGRVESDEMSVSYGGGALYSRQRCTWKVRVWDGEGAASDWSDAAAWEMGLLAAADWKGRWIGAPDSACPAPLFRKRFELAQRPAVARAYICGLGYHELYINGRRVGDHVLDPAQTDYESRALYVAHDVSDLLVEGPNAIGVMLGKGFFDQHRVWGGLSYGQPRFIFQLHCDGEMVLASDMTWLTTPGPILEDNVYAGETYDARHEVPRWSEVECDEKSWSAAVELASPTKSLQPQLFPPIRRVRTLAPVKITRLSPASHIFDMGQNFAGWVRLSLPSQKRGDVVRVRTAEAVHADGTLDTASTGVFATGVEQIDTFISAGAGPETYEPRFTYHGFRYAEITGLAHEPVPETATGVVVHSDAARIGSFECSDPVLHRIYEAAIWTLVSNLHGIPTDCPAREKCGWLGDAHIIAELALLNFDLATFFDKFVRDIQTSWRGDLPGHVAPGKRGSEPDGNPDWGVAVVLIPWYCWLYGGDESFLRDHYPSMKRFLDNARPHLSDGIASKGFGDWCPPGSVKPVLTPVALTTTAWIGHAARVMALVARRLGRAEDAAVFASLAAELAAAFNRKFFDAAAKTYGSQTADAMALELRLAPPEHRSAVAASLARDVTLAHGAHHTTGIFGSRYLFDALSRNGHGAAALAVLRQTTYPSLGDLFARGATTMWECWGEPELDEKWGARSQNHPMQAALAAWFHQGLAGINPSAERAGFAHVVLRPQIIDDAEGKLTWVRASHLSPRGLITSAWERTGPRRATWRTQLPPNVTASVQLPGQGPREIGSGKWEFQVQLPERAAM